MNPTTPTAPFNNGQPLNPQQIQMLRQQAGITAGSAPASQTPQTTGQPVNPRVAKAQAPQSGQPAASSNPLGSPLLGNIKSHITNDFNEAKQSQTAAMEGTMNPLAAGANLAKNASDIVLSPLSETVGKAFGAVTNPVVKALSDKLGNSPSVQKFAKLMDEHPELGNAISDVTQSGLNAATLATMTSGAQKVPSAIKNTADTLSNAKTAAGDVFTNTKEHVGDAIQQQATKARIGEFQQAFNQAKGTMATEAKYGKSSPEFAVQLEKEGTKLPVLKDSRGRADWSEAIDNVKTLASRDNKAMSRLLDSSGESISLDKVESDAIARAQNDFKGTDQAAAIKHIQEEFDAYKQQYRSIGFTDANGGFNIPARFANEIKSDLWGKSKFTALSTPTDQVKAGSNYMAGNVLKNEIQDAVGHDNLVGQLNQRLGDYQSLIQTMQKANGGAIHGGFIGKMAYRMVGAVAGEGAAGPFGALGGAITGDMISDALTNPNNSLARYIIARAETESPGILKQVENQIGVNHADIMNRTALPSPSYMPMGGPKDTSGVVPGSSNNPATTAKYDANTLRLPAPANDTHYMNPTQEGKPYTPNQLPYQGEPILGGQRESFQEKYAINNNIASNPIDTKSISPTENMSSPTKIVTDVADVQKIKNSIVEGQNILKRGTDTLGNRLTPDQRLSIERAIKNGQEKIGEGNVSGESTLGKVEESIKKFFENPGASREGGYVRNPLFEEDYTGNAVKVKAQLERNITAGLDKAVSSGDVPADHIFQKDGQTLKPEVAEGRIKDVAANLQDYYGPGVAKSFTTNIDMNNVTFKNLRTNVNMLIDNQEYMLHQQAKAAHPFGNENVVDAAKVNEPSPLANPETLKNNINSMQPFDIKKAIASGDVPREEVYGSPMFPGDPNLLNPKYAVSLSSEIAERLDKFKPGLGNEFLTGLNVYKASEPQLLDKANKIIDFLSAGAKKSESVQNFQSEVNQILGNIQWKAGGDGTMYPISSKNK